MLSSKRHDFTATLSIRFKNERPVVLYTRLVDVTLSRLKRAESTSPDSAVESGESVLRLHCVATDGKTGKSIVETLSLAEREPDPVRAIRDGDGVLGRIDRCAHQGHFAFGLGFDPVHLGHVQRGQLASPRAAVIGGLAIALRLDHDVGRAWQSLHKGRLQVFHANLHIGREPVPT